MTRVDGDVTNPELYQRLAKKLDEVEAEYGTEGNVIFYLAVASSLFGTIVERLGEAGLTKEDKGWRRVIIEKPFGTDLESARELDRRILERAVRIADLSDGPFPRQGDGPEHHGPALRERHLRAACGTATISTMSRSRSPRRSASSGAANFYEATGALRDMVPNHVFQLLEPDRDGAAELVPRRCRAHREGQGARGRDAADRGGGAAATSCAGSTPPASSAVSRSRPIARRKGSRPTA